MDSTVSIVEHEIQGLLRLSEAIPGWTRGEEARELARLSFAQGRCAVLVEVGSFLGSSTILLAGPRRMRGSGKVHCVDPFDCSGDDFSVPHYRRILDDLGGGDLRGHFDRFIEAAGLQDWVEIHPGTASGIAAGWERPIDLLYLDGDQSRTGAREAHDNWSRFLKPGGIIALHNTDPANRTPGHDGHRHLVETVIRAPAYDDIRRIRATTFARKV